MSDQPQPGVLFAGLPVEEPPPSSAHDTPQPAARAMPNVHQGARQPTDDEDAKFAAVMRRTFPSVR